MHILIISYAYFPVLSPRAFRWTAIAEELAQRGYKVEVVCASNTNQPLEELRNGVRIHRVGVETRETIKRYLGMEETRVSSLSKNNRQRESQNNKWIAELTKLAYSTTIKLLLWPDFAALWYFAAKSIAHKLVRRNAPNILITSSLPYTCHLVGLSIKKTLNLHWVVDIGDPFSFTKIPPINNLILYKKINSLSEAKVLSMADAVSVTTQQTKDRYLNCFPKIREQAIHVIPPLYSLTPKGADLPKFFGERGRIRLVFAGTLYRDIRNPTPLLNLFERLLATSLGGRLELHFFGVMNDCAPCFVPYSSLEGAGLFLHGLKPRHVVQAAMQESTVLVNLGNATDYQLPSKVVEYLALGKPVLNIIQDAGDSSNIYFDGASGICTISVEDIPNSSAMIDKVVEFIRSPPSISLEYVERISSRHGPVNITEQYLQIFHEFQRRLETKC